MMSRTLKQGQKGTTLIELVISIIVLGIAASALMGAFANLVETNADPLWRNKSLKLGQLYLDEILAKVYDDSTPLGGLPAVASPSCASLGPDGSETRPSYNDVDDYNGLNDAPPVSLIGSLDASYAQYSVSVTVACDGDDVGATSNNHAKKITVTVLAPGQPSPMTFAVYKANF